MCPPVPPAAMTTLISIADWQLPIGGCFSDEDDSSQFGNRKWPVGNSHAFPCLDTFSSTPAANRLIASDEPPALTKGKGIPFVGTSDNVTLMLKNACAMIIVVSPTASNC